MSAQLQAMIASARADVDKDYERWTKMACAQDTEEAEESGRLIGYLEGLKAAAKALNSAHVHVVEVFGRTDGIYVFADLDDAIAFEEAVNGNDDLATGSKCFRREEVVCNHEDALKLIESEKEE